MPGLEMLMQTVCRFCNNLEHSIPNLTDPEQYETQQRELLEVECIIKEVVFKTAVTIVNEEDHKQYLLHIFRGLSVFSNKLKYTLAKEKKNKDSPVVLLQQQALSVIERLTHFFYACFPYIKALAIDNAAEKIHLDVSVPMIATFTKALMKGTGMPNALKAARIIKFISRHVSSMNSGKISPGSFRNHYDNPEPGVIREVIIILEKMISYLKNL